MNDEEREKRFQEIVDGMPTHVLPSFARMSEVKDVEDAPDEIVMGFSVSEKGWGFGEFVIALRQGKVFIDTEYEGGERIVEFVKRMVASAVLDTDQDPERHKLYNEVMGRRCGESCGVCHP